MQTDEIIQEPIIVEVEKKQNMFKREKPITVDRET